MTGQDTYEHLLYHVDDDHICWLTLNRPDKLNALNDKLVTELCDALEQADRDTGVHAIVIRGAGRGFCSGHDLSEDAEDEFNTVYEYRDHYQRQQHEFIAAWRVSTPVIASIHYCAIGKAFELAMFCDIAIATEDTRFGYKEMRYGISGMNMVLPFLVGMKDAKDLILTGREITAREASDMGIITGVVGDKDALDAATLKKAKLVARMPRDSQRVHKNYLNRVYEMQGLKAAADLYQDLMTMMSFCPVPEYQEFSRETIDKGLRSALSTAQKRYHGLD